MLSALLLSSFAFADSPITGSERQQAAIGRCLQVFGEHPFGEAPKFRVLSTSVRVMGVGSREIVENATEAPDLVLIEPSVNVLTKTTYKLNNPNGWYCFNANVGVLSKIVFDAACGANLADSRTGTVVMGDSETNGGVVVLGDVEIKRSCPANPAAAPATPGPPAPATELAPVEEKPAEQPADKPQGYVH